MGEKNLHRNSIFILSRLSSSTRRILNTHCEDAATEDTIYYIGEALRRGVIDLDVFIKQLRALSRKRLLLRSLLEKCRLKAGLAV